MVPPGPPVFGLIRNIPRILDEGFERQLPRVTAALKLAGDRWRMRDRWENKMALALVRNAE